MKEGEALLLKTIHGQWPLENLAKPVIVAKTANRIADLVDDQEINTARPHGRNLSDLWLDGEVGKLHPAEDKLLLSAARGDECWIGNARPTFKNPDNCVRAEFLRFVVLGGDEGNPLHESGVRLVGAYVYSVSERLDFEGCTITENVWLRHCRIDCDLCLRDASVESLGLTGCSVRSISGDRLKSTGSFHLRYGFVSSGLVSLKGAKVGGSLNLKGARLENEPISLACDGIQTDVSLFLSEGFSAQGTVNLQNSEIGGDLTCSEGAMLCEDTALNVQRSTIEGAVFLNDGALFMGLVDLRSSRIDGSIFSGRATFSGKGYAVNAARINVGGAVKVGEDSTYAGTVSFQGATIGGDVSFQAGSFEGKPAVNLRNTDVNGMLVWRDIKHARGELNLAGLSCRTLNMDWSSWEKPDTVRLDQFQYKGFSELPKGCDTAFWIRWLERQPDNHLNEKFRPAPYRQLAEVLSIMGNEQEAVAIRVERRRKQSLFTRRYEPVSDDPMARAMRFLVNVWNFVQGALVDYGYRPGKAILFLLALIGIGAGIFQYAALKGVMTPTHPLIYKEAAGGFIPTACSKNWVYPDKSIKSACEKAIPGEYSTFNALMYSADLALPIVDFRMQSDWSPRVVTWPDGKWPNTAWPFPATLGGWVRLWEWAQVILGWVLSLLFVSAVGGIIRR